MAECLFCRIAQHQLEATIVAEEPELVAFHDLHPQAPTHLLIIPTAHIATLSDLTEAAASIVAKMVNLANRLARQFKLVGQGYRVVINCGPQAGQSVDHLHLHLLGGRVFRWPPG